MDLLCLEVNLCENGFDSCLSVKRSHDHVLSPIYFFIKLMATCYQKKKTVEIVTAMLPYLAGGQISLKYKLKLAHQQGVRLLSARTFRIFPSARKIHRNFCQTLPAPPNQHTVHCDIAMRWSVEDMFESWVGMVMVPAGNLVISLSPLIFVAQLVP